MVSSVLYAIYKQDVLQNILDELASVIVAHSARDYKVGLLVFSTRAAYLAQPIQPLTVALVEKFREAAISIFEKIQKDNTFLPEAASQKLNIDKARIAADATKTKYDHLIVVKSDDEALYYPHGTGSLQGLKGTYHPRKPVRPVKVFDGYFTVGDPKNPQLQFPVELYPAARKAKSTDVISRVDNRRITQTTKLLTDDGAEVDPNTVERGFLYLKQLVVVDESLKNLLEGEFEGASPWPKAFEMLAVVPSIPPWIFMEKTDYVCGKDTKARVFFSALNDTLLKERCNVLARLCHEPKKTPQGTKLKGRVELVALHPRTDGTLVCSRVPFAEEFRSYYRFTELPQDPTPEEIETDDLMDQLVKGMTSEDVPIPVENPQIERTSQFLRDFIAKGKADVPPFPKMRNSSKFPEQDTIGKELMKKFGIKKRELKPANASQPTASQTKKNVVQFDFI